MKIKKQQSQQIRIIGGTHRRSLVTFVEAEGLRPTTDRVREQVFNWLGQRFNQQRVLDLFGGSGVMGFEAASRGASVVDIIELNKVTCKHIQKLQQQFQFHQVNVHHTSAVQFLSNLTDGYDLIFLDPPYQWDEWDRLWLELEKICNEEVQIYIESAQLPVLPNWLEWNKQDSAGVSHYGIARLSRQGVES